MTLAEKSEIKDVMTLQKKKKLRGHDLTKKKENKRSWPSNSHFFSKGMTSLKKEIWYVWPLLKKWELEGPTLPRKVKLRYVWPFLEKVRFKDEDPSSKK